ncbi:MAG: DUF2087 domain-containing protein [Nocardioides sp.]
MEAAERRIIDTFFRDGRLALMPTKRSKLVVVLAHLAESFEPGRDYSEAEVNEILGAFHNDVAALRRYLVDDRFLDRENSIYWRVPPAP